MNLSEHFTLEEFTFSDTAARLGIDNTPPADIVARLRIVAANLENLRKVLDSPLRITSCYRSPQLNAQVPGSANDSAHTLGWAADFVCPQFGTPLDVCQVLASSNIRFDQLIHEYGTWTHISFDPRMRGQTLTIWHGSGGYRQGIIPIPG